MNEYFSKSEIRFLKECVRTYKTVNPGTRRGTIVRDTEGKLNSYFNRRQEP